ncbi:MAG: efflux RND transporter periplasmic adaptor subunit [Epsilonproteobacteria bacterium]|nr:MAG: efflux RND transporter periplasmic adaptor subunit [Campylobacterota bacterium]
MRNTNLIKSAIVIAIFSATTVFAGGPPAGMKMPTPKADIYVVEKPTDVSIMLKYPARVQAYEKVQVVARVTGILEKKFFTEGKKVKKGAQLFQIEDDIYRAGVDAAKASLQMSQATLDNATIDWDRFKKLYKQKAVTEDKRDNALSAYKQALASVALSKAQLKQANINLAYTKVKAPITAIADLKQLNVGNLVTPGTKLVKMTRSDKVYIDFSMPLSDYVKIKSHIWSIKGNGAIKISIEINGKVMDKVGTVDFIDVNIDSRTSVVKFRAKIDNSDGSLMPGAFVRVITNNIIQKNVTLVPQKAVLQSPEGSIVFIEDHGHVGVKPVFLGDEYEDKYIVSGPLTSDDRVIVNNFFRLKPGGEVIADVIINKQGK